MDECDRDDYECRRDREYDDAMEMSTSGSTDNWHSELPTMLYDRHIGIDVRRWMGMVSMMVNGHVRVSVQDGIADDGVVHVIESVLIPPRNDRDRDEDEPDNYDNDNMTVEELKERLERYVERERRDNRHRNNRDL
jgi:hypothetical protein